ncbi:hypothetical protein TSOC_009025 [Tetrabaena socialis]|uniref:Uncharacterized protein n=1 Tax=Tetrabaena socialis TaxID=47790 RepID=A0A2J7ZX30_9CHLO|nr:hypothetical protein TSOC_009025 [Tetrabaena socialis]|eukprot:PNH04831.1 hypothetical protein TSOC_009025 [Tetrabaena socialis]
MSWGAGVNSGAASPPSRIATSYRVVGPARISRRGDTLVARLFRGSRVELLDREGNAIAVHSSPNGAPYMGAAADEDEEEQQDEFAGFGECDAEGDGCLGECVLVAALVELGGSAANLDLADLSVQPAVHHHHGRTYLSVRCLPEQAVIELSADADLSHPINVTPECAGGS